MRGGRQMEERLHGHCAEFIVRKKLPPNAPGSIDPLSPSQAPARHHFMESSVHRAALRQQPPGSGTGFCSSGHCPHPAVLTHCWGGWV